MPTDNLRGHTWVEAYDGSEYRLDVEVTPGCVAKTYGPPENCYPAEPSELADCTLSGPITQSGGRWDYGPIVAQGEEEICEFFKTIGVHKAFDDFCEIASLDAWER